MNKEWYEKVIGFCLSEEVTRGREREMYDKGFWVDKIIDKWTKIIVGLKSSERKGLYMNLLYMCQKMKVFLKR